jgi:hypothetical protein
MIFRNPIPELIFVQQTGVTASKQFPIFAVKLGKQ